MSECNPAWQFFAALQSEADPQSIDRSLARDEALDVVLDEILADQRPPDEHLIRKRFRQPVPQSALEAQPPPGA